MKTLLGPEVVPSEANAIWAQKTTSTVDSLVNFWRGYQIRNCQENMSADSKYNIFLTRTVQLFMLELKKLESKLKI
jgi:hypothetical protein